MSKITNSLAIKLDYKITSHEELKNIIDLIVFKLLIDNYDYDVELRGLKASIKIKDYPYYAVIRIQDNLVITKSDFPEFNSDLYEDLKNILEVE